MSFAIQVCPLQLPCHASTSVGLLLLFVVCVVSLLLCSAPPNIGCRRWALGFVADRDLLCLVFVCLCSPGPREPGSEPFGIVGEQEQSLSLLKSTVDLIFSCHRFTRESACATGRGSWWLDVTACTLVFVTTSARYYT